MSRKRRIDNIIRNIEDEVAYSDEYYNYDSDLEGENFDPDDGILNYDSDMFDPDDGVLNYEDTGIKGAGLSTYALSIVYDPAGGGLAPVTVELWGTDLNTGTPLGDDLLFTNGAGDRAIVSGRTSPFIPMQDSLRYEPFRARFARMVVQDAGQFFNTVRFQFDSKWGGGKFNSELPDEFFEPQQFQNLRTDIPMGFPVGPRDRMIFDVNPSEVAPGMSMIFFIDASWDAKRAVSGKRPLIKMGGKGLMQQMPSRTQTAAINKVIKSQQLMLKNIKAITPRGGRRR